MTSNKPLICLMRMVTASSGAQFCGCPVLMFGVQPAGAAAGADQHGHQRHRGEGGEDDAAGGPGRGRAHQLPGVCGHDDQVIVKINWLIMVLSVHCILSRWDPIHVIFPI